MTQQELIDELNKNDIQKGSNSIIKPSYTNLAEKTEIIGNKSRDYNLIPVNFSYTYYVTPVYYHKNTSLHLDNFLSRPSYVKVYVDYVPEYTSTLTEKDYETVNYILNNQVFHSNFNQTKEKIEYKKSALNYQVSTRLFLNDMTGVYGSVYIINNNSTSENSSITEDGLGIKAGLIHFLNREMMLAIYADMFSLTEEYLSMKNEYSSITYTFNSYYVPSKRILAPGFSGDNFGFGIDYDLTIGTSDDIGIKSDIITHFLKFKTDLYLMKFLMIGFAYGRTFGGNKNDFINEEINKNEYEINLNMFYTDLLQFKLSYAFNNDESKYYQKKKEDEASYTEAKGYNLGLGIGYRL